jgi:superfamily II DNA/RNA helicase
MASMKNTTKEELEDKKSVNSDIDSDIDSDTDTDSENEMEEQYDDFDDMEFLSLELSNGIGDNGFNKPSPIQASSIHIINKGKDIIAQAQSGTGKTGAFVIGTLSRVEPNKKYPQVVIVGNTKTLAYQIEKVVKNISKFMNISTCICIGGKTMTSRDNLRKAQNSHILIGTPGRMGDILSRGNKNGSININKIKSLVLDETDVLLGDDFREQIKTIIRNIGKSTQMCIFSATYTSETYKFVDKMVRNPYKIKIKPEELSLDDVKQYQIKLQKDVYKYATLKDLLTKLQFQQMIIFVNKKRTAEIIRDKLIDDGHESGMIAGSMDDIQREQILREFRLGNMRILISTDLIARGFDVDDLRCVINYDFAKDSDTYLHRVGRSGRYGSQGIAINFVTNDDIYKVTALQGKYNIKIPSMPHPDDINEILTGITAPNDKVLNSKMYRDDAGGF